MKLPLVIALASLLAGCASKKPVAPALMQPHCPALSDAHVACVGRLQEGVSHCPDGGHLEFICQDKATGGIFDMAMRYNPYENIDGEDEAQAWKPHPWWKFWVRERHEGKKDEDKN